MNDLLNKIKAIEPREALMFALTTFQKHTLTILILLAGILVGFALQNVNDLTKNTSITKPLDGTEEIVIAGSGQINLDEETQATLLRLKQDTDVDVSSNIASYRRSAFSDITDESEWVIETATLLERYKERTASYPNESQLAAAIASENAAFAITDPQNIPVNQTGSAYTYIAERCEGDACEGFLLSAQLDTSIYQLGETDATKRTWINDTAQALDVFYKFEDRNYYPLESQFAAQMSTFYTDVFEEDFIAEDPNSTLVNADNSAYAYRGIDCDASGCTSFVLRTTFKDGASYFQQNQ